MSAQLPPDPILTTYQYWNWKSVDEATRRQRALDNNYMTFPTVQNYPTFFSKLFFITDATLTKMANTAYVFANLVAYLASLLALLTSTTWLALQNFTTIETDSINPILSNGTLTIGSGVDHDIRIASQANRTAVLHLGDGNSSVAVHINNGLDATGNVNILNGVGSTGTITLGTRRISPSISTTLTSLSCPLTPAYSYPIGTQIAPTTPSIGKEGTIGFIPSVTFIGNTTGDGSAAGGLSVRSVSLTQGVWLIAGTVRTNGFAGTNAITIGAVQNSSASPIYGRKGTWSYSAGQPAYPWGLATMATVYISTTTTLYLSIRNSSATLVNYANFTCIRIA